MEIHKAKAVHGWRELLNEVGVIVIGVVIALTGEQAAEALHWRHTVHLTRESLSRDLSEDLSNAADLRAFGACDKAYLDLLESAIVENRTAAIEGLRKLGPPAHRSPWVDGAWKAALGGDVANHLNRDELSEYALAFGQVSTEFQLMFQITDHYAEALAGPFGPAAGPQVMHDQLAAIRKIRSDQAVRLAVAGYLLDQRAPRLKVAPDKTRVANAARKAAACESAVKALL